MIYFYFFISFENVFWEKVFNVIILYWDNIFDVEFFDLRRFIMWFLLFFGNGNGVVVIGFFWWFIIFYGFFCCDIGVDWRLMLKIDLENVFSWRWMWEILNFSVEDWYNFELLYNYVYVWIGE